MITITALSKQLGVSTSTFTSQVRNFSRKCELELFYDVCRTLELSNEEVVNLMIGIMDRDRESVDRLLQVHVNIKTEVPILLPVQMEALLRAHRDLGDAFDPDEWAVKNKVASQVVWEALGMEPPAGPHEATDYEHRPVNRDFVKGVEA